MVLRIIINIKVMKINTFLTADNIVQWYIYIVP